MTEPRKLSVFLCHASQDKPVVRELYQRLTAEGWVDPWLDEEKLIPGQTWTATIQDAIDSADSVIIFLSEHSVNKEGFVQRELKRAWKVASEKPEDAIFLIPFRLENCTVPRKLRSKQWGDYFGESKEKTYNSLVVSLKARHKQKLEQEKKELERVQEVVREQKESEEKIRQQKMEVYFNEAVARQNEERIRREKAEAQLAAERARWEDEKKTLLKDSNAGQQADASASGKESPVHRPSIASITNLSASTGSSILIDSSIVHFESLGRGRPVIFLHGWVGSWRYWFRSMQVVSRSFRSYALDLWGFGGTSHNLHHYSLDEQATLLDHFLMEMGIGKIALVGHGLGALVGMTFASRFPQSVDRLMAVSCPLEYADLNRRMGTSSPSELNQWLSNHTPEAITALADAYKVDPLAITASLSSFQEDNPLIHFRNFNIPCLLVYGEKDPAVRSPDSESFATTMMQVIELEDAGHFPMLDVPNVFERWLMSFLTLPSGMTPRELTLR